jgi:hypothetical protein
MRKMNMSTPHRLAVYITTVRNVAHAPKWSTSPSHQRMATVNTNPAAASGQ